ncbi:cell envelope integrity protein CreD [Pseudoalteromonas sp. SMS1]|uniref:cell envelope integrity protein CreD n=1 Tax=Pseudoalteromonas sp. SMS1 TaxID=2908894 RepID=UPI001EEEAFFA|nr:cell envelope integrity protein CreD [Pseudoalteromonas sp. SMS1]MCF2857101.1 cell envelope integrity protein CreD [Pseudoalteromonas sp. SMS1]
MMNNQNKEKIGVKFATLIGLIVALMIPMVMIEDLISERSEMQKQVQQEIAKSSSAQQRIVGPFIYVEYERELARENSVSLIKENTFLLPDKLLIHSELDTYEKYRSIYKATLYHAKNAISGVFNISDLHTLKDHRVISASLVFGISDIRGIGLDSMIKVAGEQVKILPGTGVKRLKEGVHVPLEVTSLFASSVLSFSADLHLQGMEKLAISPVGKETRVTMNANWPHPSFVGAYLPLTSEINDAAFSANWQASYFSTNMQSTFESCILRSECSDLTERTIGVALVDPVDHYLKSHRAVNYALMVILLVVASFFLLELIRDEPIHPVQYGFVGLALAIFYLLLISLSEHLGFGLAYVISSLAATGLLGWYVSGVLKNRVIGGYFFVGLIMLYSLLYGMLGAEDYALLMGSLMCFIVLSLVMILTRHINWYGSAKSMKVVTDQ